MNIALVQSCVSLKEFLHESKVKLVKAYESVLKAPFSKATTSRCRGRHYSFFWITPLYP